jgi:predicted O-methyltransferase YrrM
MTTIATKESKTEEDDFHSSYKTKDLTFQDVLQTIVATVNPKKIVEYGILDGFSLNTFITHAAPDCQLYAYDIFEKFVGNGARKEILNARFSQHENVAIEEGDFYDSPTLLEDGTVDILHIDIANNGDVYEFAVTNLVQKLSDHGVMILEGGTPARDEVEWMSKYNKRPINPYLQSLKDSDSVTVSIIGHFPGLTIVKKK